MRRILVAQADARAVAGGTRAPLSVAVVRWRGDGERLAVVAKLALRFDSSADELRFAQAPPMQLQNGDDADSFVRPLDFVFRKHNCDILVVGHAHASEPQDTLAVRVRIGALDHSFTAAAPDDEPTLDVPLASKWLRDARLHPVELGPQPPQREGRYDVVEAYDHRRGQCAPAHMQIEQLSCSAELILEGLSPRRQQRRLCLPGLFPRVWHDGPTGFYSLNMTLDTLLLDTDFERIELTWRMPLPSGITDRKISRLIVALESEAAPRDETAVLGLLPRGTFSFADEETDVAAGDPDELEMARYEALEYAAEPELTIPEFAVIVARLAEGDRDRTDVLADVDYDEHTWGIEERAQAEVLGNAAAAWQRPTQQRHGRSICPCPGCARQRGGTTEHG